MKRTQILFALAAVALLLTPHGQALAQAMGDLPTLDQLRSGAGDSTARRIFVSLLGEDLVSNPITATHLLGMVFFIFNGALFVVGVGFILYKSIMMVAVSANEGAVLGKNMSSLWIPIRLGTGIFGMAPVFMGFSLAQAAMFSVALLGNGLADMMAKTAIEANNDFHVIVPAPGIKTVANEMSIDTELARTLFGMHVCGEAYARYTTAIGGKAGDYATLVTDGSGVRVVGGLTADRCGGVAVIDQVDDVARDGDSLGFRNPAVQYDNIRVLAEGIRDARVAALHTLSADMQALATAWYDQYALGVNTPDYPAPKIATAVARARAKEKADTETLYRAAAEAAVNADGSGAVTDAAKAKMTEGGWMSLGSWYSAFAESNAAIQSAHSASHFEVTPLRLDTGRLPEIVGLPLAALGGQQEATGDGDCSTLGVEYRRNAVGACAPMQNALLSMLDAAMGDSGGDGMVNPVTASKNLGDWLLVGVGSSMTVSAVSALADYIPGANLAASAVSRGLSAAKNFLTGKTTAAPAAGLFSLPGSTGQTVLTAALVLGLVLAVYVPLIPFLTWFSACVSYFVSVIEGLVAAQVWAFSHLHTDGEGMGQRAERGYIYMLNMLLRPPLMVLGFFFAGGILTLMGTFFFQQLAPALANAQGNTMTGPFITVGVIALVSVVTVSLVQTVFNMTYELPDRVIAWFGGGMEARMAPNMDREIEGKMGRAAQWSGHAALVRGVTK